MDAFLLYVRKDISFAIKVHDYLHRNGISVWFDRSEIAPGENWEQATNDALSRAQSLLFLVSANSIKSVPVLSAIEDALVAKKRVVLIAIGELELRSMPQLLWNSPLINVKDGVDLALTLIKENIETSSDAQALSGSIRNNGYVFLSYAAEDSEFVIKLRCFIMDNDFAYWDYNESDRDYHNSFSIELEGVMLNSSAVFSVISDNWKRSRWANREFHFAEDARIPVFLLRAEAVGPTLAIAGTPYIDFVEDVSAGFDTLQRELTRKKLKTRPSRP